MKYRRKDAHYLRARAEGYRARSAYKLIELDRRFRLLRAGDLVLDLGCWPGGWLQVALERIGPGGRAVGVDVARVEPLNRPNLRLVQGDLREPATLDAVRGALERPADVVLSDLAPKLTGIAATDEARQAELTAVTLAALATLLRPGGRLLMKLFMTEDHPALLRALRDRFARVHLTRPEATRRGSSELYAVGDDFRTGTGDTS